MTTSLVNNKYRITRRIGGGSFGEIYLGVGPSGEKVAVKFERQGTRCPQLRHEYKVYREVANCHGYCKVHYFGNQDNYNVMVMDLLGPSLEDLFNRCSRRFSLKTVLQLADQMLERVDIFHSRHLIHRDIKPANFVIGTGDTANIVFCVDFGLSKRYRHPKSLQHIPHRDGRSLTGTPRYASINNHLGVEQSRRDDLESIAYVLIYFLKGSLPWQGLKAKNAQKKYRLILEKKQQVSIAQLCAGCPSQFGEFLAYSRSLKFDAKPDIPYLRKLFRDLYHAQGCSSIAKLWDWDNLDPDSLMPGGVADTATSNNPTAGIMSSNLNSNMPMSQADEDEKPTTANKNWGFTPADPTPTPAAAAVTSAQRPHTAHGGRSDGIGTSNNGAAAGDEDHVVAGARAMMRYRKTKDTTTTPAAGAPSTSRSWGQGPGGDNKEEVSGGVNRTTTTKSGGGGMWAPDSRPKSAGVLGTAARNNSSGRPPSGAAVTSNNAAVSSNPNTLSYGALRNRFLSGTRTKSSKLFSLSR